MHFVKVEGGWNYAEPFPSIFLLCNVQTDSLNYDTVLLVTITK